MTLTAGQQAWVDEQVGADTQACPVITGTTVAAFDVGDDRVRFIIVGTDGELATYTATAPLSEEEAEERGAALSRLAEVEQRVAEEAEAERAAAAVAAADEEIAERLGRVVGMTAEQVKARLRVPIT